MSSSAEEILGFLHRVAAERARRRSTPGLALGVSAVKEYQLRRFEASYAGLLASGRHGPAARFFLEELYGPQDFTRRDSQLARVVPTLDKLFPQEVVETSRRSGPWRNCTPCPNFSTVRWLSISIRQVRPKGRHCQRWPIVGHGNGAIAMPVPGSSS
jgi:hypothetical protein